MRVQGREIEVKLALVTNYCPDQRPLSEYGYHLVHGLRESGPDREVIILSGKCSVQSGDGELRVWDYGGINIPFQVLEALKANCPDGVLINTHFTSWGSNLANLAGLLTPMLVQKAGFRTIALIHHLPQTIDAKRAGYRLTPFHRMAIELACWALAKSDAVCFTLQKNLDYFQQRYRPQKAILVPLGLQGKPSWRPPPAEGNRVLTFGNWGRSKDPEPLIRNFLRKEKEIEGRLIVAGGSSHTRKGFMENLRQKYDSSEKVIFTGYVPEPDIPNLFHSTNLVVLPYNENTGASAVAYQACQYGRVILTRRLPVFEEMERDLGIKIYLYNTEEEMLQLLCELLSNPMQLAEEGYHNYCQVQHLTMDKVSEVYWRLLEE